MPQSLKSDALTVDDKCVIVDVPYLLHTDLEQVHARHIVRLVDTDGQQRLPMLQGEGRGGGGEWGRRIICFIAKLMNIIT